MKWKGRRQSSNVEDRRGSGSSVPRKAFSGGIGTIFILLIVWFLGGNPLDLLGLLTSGNSSAPVATGNYQPTEAENELAQFVGVVLADTEEVWGTLFRSSGQNYKAPKLVLYNQAVQSACGFNSSATGPFYCPGDEKIYIDLDFYRELNTKFRAPGDFAMAYVIAHEVGHHIQNLTGVSQQVMQMRNRVNKTEFNQMMVRLELQADFYAGVYAHFAHRMKVLDEGDIDEALGAAAAVGDDRIQKQAQGYVVPESFTHGSSEQRKRWFYKGFTTGDVNQGNTFEATQL